MMKKGGGGRGDEIVGKKFPMPLSGAEVFEFILHYITLLTPSLTRSEEEEGSNKLD